MSRGITRTMTVVLVLISVFLLVSPGVFSNTFVKIDDTGLKGIQIRADIYKANGPGDKGQKHGMLQVIIREETPQFYTYKFMINLRKVSRSTHYYIGVWADLPNIEFTIFGDGSLTWQKIELAAFLLDIDTDGYYNNNQIETSLAILGLNGHNEFNTNIYFTTDERGFYKNIKTGGINEMDAIEWAIDFIWPYFRQRLLYKYPGLISLLPLEVDFAYFGIKGLKINGGTYTISMGAKFMSKMDSYHTEDITFTHSMGDFEWWA